MSDWTISVVQLPIRLPGIGDTGFRHNTIVIRDGNGAFYRELNGGPVDANGNLIDFRNPVAQSTTAYTSGQYLVGVKDSSVAFYSAGLGSGTQVYSGSQEQVLARYDAALSCADEINALSRKYTLATGMILVDRDTNTTEPSFNSNSVAATVLECMGLNSNNPAFSNSTTPGSNNPILSQPQVRDIIQQQNETAPPGSQVPFPPGRRSDTLDHSDGSFDIATRDENGNLLTLAAYDSSGRLIRTEEHFGTGEDTVVTLNSESISTDVRDALGRSSEIIVVGEHTVSRQLIDLADNFDWSSQRLISDFAHLQLASVEVGDNNQVTSASYRGATLGGDIGAAFGSTIGNYLGQQIGGNNLAIKIGAGTLAGAIGRELGSALQYAGTYSLGDAVAKGLADVPGGFAGGLPGAAIGSLSSLLIGELADQLHLPGFAAGALQTVSGSVTTQLVTNAWGVANASINPSTGQLYTLADGFNTVQFAEGLSGAIGGYLGGTLQAAIAHPQYPEGAVGQQLGASIGSIPRRARARAQVAPRRRHNLCSKSVSISLAA